MKRLLSELRDLTDNGLVEEAAKLAALFTIMIVIVFGSALASEAVLLWRMQ